LDPEIAELKSSFLLNMALASACVVLVSAGSAGAQSEVRPEQPGWGSLPAEWYQFAIEWKPAWDETLATNLAACTAGAVADPALQPFANGIAQYRRIWLLESLMARFPQDRARRVKACVEIAEAWQRAGLQYWRSVWGVRLLTDFPDDPEAVRQGYQFALGWGFGQYIHWGTYVYAMFPECRDFAFLIPDIIEKNRTGRLPDDHPGVLTAYAFKSWLMTDLLRYDEFHPFLDTLRAKGRARGGLSAGGRGAAGALRARGGRRRPRRAKPKGGGGLGTASIVDSDGVVRDVRPDYELENAGKLLCKGRALADGRSRPDRCRKRPEGAGPDRTFAGVPEERQPPPVVLERGRPPSARAAGRTPAAASRGPRTSGRSHGRGCPVGGDKGCFWARSAGIRSARTFTAPWWKWPKAICAGRHNGPSWPAKTCSRTRSTRNGLCEARAVLWLA
jgi:hypothetical protein